MAHTPLDETKSNKYVVALTQTYDQMAWRTFVLKLLALVAASILVLTPAFGQSKKDRFEQRKERERTERAKEQVKGIRVTPDHLTRSAGREVTRGEQNMTQLSNYQLAHPPRVARHKVENEEIGETEVEPVHGALDPSMVRQKAAARGAYGPAYSPGPMPSSGAPASSFESTPDNNTYIPPDTHGAVDSNYCVTTVNGNVHIQTKTGTNVSNVTLDAFWAPVLSGGGSFDPRVHYDPYSNRWILVTVSGSFSASSSILLAVSKTSNPTGAWWMYKIDADGTDVSWIDFPEVGFNNKWITVTGNMFGNTSGYNGAKVWMFNKANAMNGTGATFTSFTQASSFTLCPTLTYTSASSASMFMVENYNYSLGAMRLWKVSGAVGSETMTSVGLPQVSSMPWWYAPNAASGSTSADFAPQSGTSSLLQNNDHRVNQMVYMNGSLWFSHTVFLPYTSGVNPTHSAVQWWQIDTFGTPVQLGRVNDASGTNYYAFPTLAVNTNNDALIGFSAFSAATHPSAAYALRLNTDPLDSIRTPYIFRSGQNAYYKDYGGGKNRWGDYSGTAIDPSNTTTFWTLQEASGTSVNSWDTWWAQVTTSSCSVAAITGTMSVCAGSTTTLADATSGGAWTSSTTSVATVGASTGVVTGVAAGTTTITYTVGSCTATAVVTVNALPATIGGASAVCVGSTTTLTDATTGGTWSSSATGVASVGSTTGVVTGVAAGTAIITYTTSAGCKATKNITVNATPSAIAGGTSVCVGTTLTLSDVTTGGTWSSSNTTVATINSTSGVATGVAAGTAIISYNLSTGCRATMTITVNALPAAITGTLGICVSGSTTLADATSGGVWASSNTDVATVGSTTGVVTGSIAGTSTITYYVPATGCFRTATVTVNASPSAITGTPTVCVGSTTSLGNTLGGGIWSSGTTSVATVNSSTGVVTGVASGVTIITYVSSCGTVTQSVTVNPNPSAITGTMSVCAGSTTTLTDATSGGTWSTGASNITVGLTSGVVTGVGAGTASVTYMLSTGCKVVATVTVNPVPASITGTTSVCVGSTTSLSSTSTGGAWTSSSPTTASVNTTGVVTGVNAGSAIISYTLPTGCRTTALVTVGTATPITGGGVVCVGSTLSLSNATSGGTWSSSAPTIASVGSSDGTVSGLATGTATITYTLSGGCKATTVITVSAAPSAITGSTSVCIGATATMTATPAGGTWSSSNTAVATIGSASGVMTGVANGSVTITYALGGGCFSTVAVAVSATPFAVTVSPSSATVCLGGSSVFSATTTIVSQNFNSGMTGAVGGTWSITNLAGTSTSVWQIWSPNGYLGITPGDGSQFLEAAPDATGSGVLTNTILTSPSFSLASFSSATLSFNQYLVSYAPYDNIVAVEYSTDGGSSWSTLNNELYAIIGSTTWSAGAPTTTLAFPPAAMASSNVQIRWNYNSTWGFYWAVDNIVVSGSSAFAWSGPSGTSGISCPTCATTTITPTTAGTSVYTVTAAASGCSASTTVSMVVNPSPAAITGASVVCVGQSITLSDATAGGSWFSSGGTVTVDASTGVATGTSAGVTAVTYMLPTGCFVTKSVTVNPIATISGTTSVCTGGTSTLTADYAGGTWSSSSTATATVSASGVVTGVASGSATITYTTVIGCYSTVMVFVSAPDFSVAVSPSSASLCLGSGGVFTAATSVNNILVSQDFNSGMTGAVGGTWTIDNFSGTSTSVWQLWSPNGYLGITPGDGSQFLEAAPDATGPGVLTNTILTSPSFDLSGYSSATLSYNEQLVSYDFYDDIVAVEYSLDGGSSWSTLHDELATFVGSGTWTVGSPSTTLSFPPAAMGSSNVRVRWNYNSVYGYWWALDNIVVTGIGAGSYAWSAPSGAPAASCGSCATTTITPTATGTYVYSVTASTGGCSAGTTVSIVVNPVPAAITGPSVMCQGQSITLSDATTGGSWSSSDETVSVNPGTGVVTGVGSGVTTITYMLSTGCYATKLVTVNASPVAISGSASVCVGSSTSLFDDITGGTWTSSATGVATVGLTSGIVTGIASGVTTITYTLSGGCKTTLSFTVNPNPAVITGTASVCQGNNTTLSDATAGGTWSSSDSTIATVGTTGIVTGVSGGIVTITYMLPTMCYRTISVTINATPSAITGTTVWCAGSTSTLSNAVAGGTWSSSITTVATVGSTTGVVTGVAAGTSTISYNMPGGCRVTVVVTINALPGVIGGSTNACVGSTTTLTDVTTGGTWSSADGSIATIGSSNGVVTGVSAGSVTITYMLATGCYRTVTILVNPVPAAISGSMSVCVGSTTSLSDATTGGTWSSSPTTVATVGSTTGVVTGVAAGMATITYAASTGCKATAALTVNALPATITGTTGVCVGATSTLSSTTTGGTWSTADGSIATIGSSNGVVTGIATGSTTATYMLPTGCYRTVNITVNAAPAAISGALAMCVGVTSTLTDATSGGTWSSSATGVATVGSTTGVVTGVTAGTANISYTAGGCRAVAMVTINALPAAITGTATVCAGGTTTLADVTAGGSWSSSDGSIASVGGTGVVTGIAAGSATITYTIFPSGCYRTINVTVNAAPAAISGSTSACAGTSVILSDPTSGGTWSSSATSVATVGSTSGIVTAVAAGVATISYKIGTCSATLSFTVFAAPAAITGTASVCEGTTTTLSSTTTGGSWSSSDITVATVGTGGIVSGVAAGNATITYMTGAGCYRTIIVTVNAAPTAISGSFSVCIGATTSLSNSVAGGVWSSSAVAIATVGSGTGVVTGVAAGVATITYTAGGCKVTQQITVNATPANITGTLSVCLGATTTLADATTGGSWFSGSGSASIDIASGVVTGVDPGTSIITYMLVSGCYKTAIVTVNALPADITGTLAVCVGATTSLSDASTPVLSWASSTTSVATISTAGVVTGVAAGTSTITYTQNTGCQTTAVVTVNAAPGAIGGTLKACVGQTTVLTDTAAGGTWTTANGLIATVGLTDGTVTGVSAGTTTITYMLATGCYKTAVVTVNALPAAITGATSVCVGSTTTLGNTATGTWTSSDITIATIGSTTRVVTGVSAGTVTITFTAGTTGCYTTMIFTVSPIPAAIGGATTVCMGNTITLTDATTGGTWLSGNTARATIGITDGIVTGVTAGTVVITYTSAAGCKTTAIVTVTSFPAITGTLSACVGMTTTLADATTGGTWTSSDATIATVGSTSGIVTGVAPGSVVITYTISSGCIRTAMVNINSLPPSISGTPTVCAGGTTSLSNATSGGTWSSSATAIATVGSSSGVVTGVTAGTATITYTVGAGCRVTIQITVNAQPAAIGGSGSVCEGATTTLTDATAGGSWSSSDGSVASVSASGVVTGVAAGSATITYMLGTGCFRTISITVNPAPAAITGSSMVCIGATTTLADATAGGAWTSSNTAVATIGASTGVVTGVTAGTANITYSTSGCITVTMITVNPLPAVITGTASVCQGGTTTLSSTTTGGSWLSSDGSIATVGLGSGVVSGVSAGTAIITYITVTGCYRTIVVTVNPLPGIITGGSAVCVGSSINLSSATTGGTWSSSSPATATVGASTGTVTGIAAGATIITYTLGTGCYVTAIVDVNAQPAAITGSTSVFTGSTTTLSDATSGGMWLSGNTSVATIGSSDGVVTGVAAGSAIITYMLPTGCYVTTIVNVSGTAAITGTLSVCVGATTSLGNPISGGTWSSGDGSVATIDASSGVVTGVSAGTSIITYAFPAGGTVTAMVTVNPLPTAFTSMTLCAGSSATLTSSPSGGTWSSNTPAVATIGSTSGIVNAIASGSTIITYMLSTGCYVTGNVDVNPLPAAIAGATTTFVGSTTTLSNAVTGGLWLSGNTSVATVGISSGVVTGVATGTALISYMLPTGCFTTAIITVNAALTGITGPGSVCVGSTIVLSDATTGGSWSSSDPTIASISGAGVVTGVATGTVTITYAMPSGATTTTTILVNPAPTAITGTLTLCAGTTTALTDATTGGTWSSSNTGIATVDASGIVTGVAGGTATISYMLSTGCYTTVVVTVSGAPGAITGAGAVCPGTTITLHSAGGGGTWSSGDVTVATVGSNTGVVTGVGAGVVVISYILPSGCYGTVSITVNGGPAAITGTTTICVGTSTALSSTTTGGTWTSSNTAVATIDATTGVYTGVSSGMSIITYSMGSGCFTTTTVSVQALPSAITGVMSVCEGGTTILSTTSSGGVWSSSDITLATVGTNGIVSGVAAGSVTITYTLASGCYVTAAVTVNPAPSTITGSTAVCVGSTSSLSSTPTGGTWSATSPAILSVAPATGVVTGAGPGTAIVTYTSPAGCKITTPVTVTSLPGNITGVLKACPGSTTALSDATPGGLWSSSDITIATVGSSDGIVTGVAGGSVTITYTMGSSCYKTTTVVINPAPSITGASVVCIGSATVLVGSPAGGTWLSADPTIATVSSSGSVSGVAVGATTITFTAPSTGCTTTLPFTVSALPGAISTASGTLKVCVGATLPLTNSVPGGTWSSANVIIATIGSTSGIATGVAAGSARITYTAPGGCLTTAFVTVNAAPAPITGSGVLCVGTTTTLAGSSGVWTSSDISIATVGSTTKIVTGVAAGTATITVTLSTGCFGTTIVTVNPVPPAIGGATTLCAGQTTTLTNTQAGGTWTSSGTSVATIGSLNGAVTAVSQGTITISYNIGTGCRTTTSFTVRPLPVAFTGPSYVCVGSTMTLLETTGGGTWSSSNISIATVGSSGSVGTGVVSGVAAGAADITYVITATGCARTKTVTVNTVPDAGTISGPTTVIIANTITLASTVIGGTWASANTSIATVGTTSGIVTGVGAGNTGITYTVNNGCGNATAVYTVDVTTSRPGGNPATEQPGFTVADMSIFPNPTTGKFSISTSEAGQLSVYTVEGRQVETYKVETGITELSLPQGLAAGIYMCRFNGNKGGTTMIRLIFEQ